MRKAMFCLLAAAAIASAKSYTVNLFQPTTFGGTELKPGEYRLEVKDQTATIRNGKVARESPVKVEMGDIKFDSTTVRYDNEGGKPRIQEIRLGGTKTKLLFN